MSQQRWLRRQRANNASVSAEIVGTHGGGEIWRSSASKWIRLPLFSKERILFISIARQAMTEGAEGAMWGNQDDLLGITIENSADARHGA